MKLTAQNIRTNEKGFTLIELLVVIGILAILLAITLIAINPARQFGNANNTKRQSAAAQVLSAIGQYQAENKGQLPATVAALTEDVATPLNSDPALKALCAQLVPDYIPAFPTNPTLNTPDIEASDCAGTWATGYSISRSATNRITVSADSTDNSAVIEVTR